MQVVWRREQDRTVIRFRLTPKSRSDAIDGLTDTADGPAVAARVRALPEDGAANRALEVLAADWLGVPKSRVAVVGGPKSRVKTIAIDGDVPALEARVAALSRG
jgi:hypothetical protein